MIFIIPIKGLEIITLQRTRMANQDLKNGSTHDLFSSH
jgi:hypothetical protein